MKGLVAGAAQGSEDCRKHWTTALIPRSLGNGAHPTSAEIAAAARIAWDGGRYQAARSAMREQGRSKTGVESLPNVKLAPMSALEPTGERQEHLGRNRLHRRSRPEEALVAGTRHSHNKWPTGDLQEECRFFLDTQLMFLKQEKGPTSKQFDDDEWIRSLTEAHENSGRSRRQRHV